MCIVMATVEQQVLTARVPAMETQLQFETARAHQAEQERSRLIEKRGSTRMDRGSAMVDTKGIGQPFTLKGTSETDFGEWTHKVRTFRDDILTDLTWDCRQDLPASQRNRMMSWMSVFGDQAGRSRTSTTLLDNCTPTLCPLQPTQEMVWKLGDNCTASTIRHRP